MLLLCKCNYFTIFNVQLIMRGVADFHIPLSLLSANNAIEFLVPVSSVVVLTQDFSSKTFQIVLVI